MLERKTSHQNDNTLPESPTIQYFRLKMNFETRLAEAKVQALAYVQDAAYREQSSADQYFSQLKSNENVAKMGGGCWGMGGQIIKFYETMAEGDAKYFIDQNQTESCSPTIKYFIIKFNMEKHLEECRVSALEYVRTHNTSKDNPADMYFLQMLSNRTEYTSIFNRSSGRQEGGLQLLAHYKSAAEIYVKNLCARAEVSIQSLSLRKQ
jgi:hypothetical protein